MDYYFAGEALDGRTGHEAGRTLLRQLWVEKIGGPLPIIVENSMGKPLFLDSAWHFSISHTPRHVFCVLAQCPVGVDAEEADRYVSEKLAKRVLSPYEYAQYEKFPDKNRAFLRFWVLKEAQAKSTGQGISYPPNQTNFNLDDPRLTETLGCLVAVVFDL